jgi:hypothetical protein
MESRKRFEIHTANTMFTFGFVWGSYRNYPSEEHIGIVIGCLIFQINLNIKNNQNKIK